MAARQGALAAGAARASGERAKRRSTPLIGAEPIVPVEARMPMPARCRCAAPKAAAKKSSDEGGEGRPPKAAEEGDGDEGSRRRHEAQATTSAAAKASTEGRADGHAAHDGAGGDGGRRAPGIRAGR